MTATTIATAATEINTASPGRLSFGRILAGELRKSIATRANRALLLVIACLTLAIAVGSHFMLPQLELGEMAWNSLLPILALASGLLLPVVVILLVTSEWSTRSAMTTFTLVPRRGLVVGAKLLVALTLTAACLALCFALALGITALNANSDQVQISWSAPTAAIVGFTISTMAATLVAFALATAMQNGPAAIVTFLGGPIILATVAGFSGQLGEVVSWFNFLPALDAVLADTSAATATQWGQLATSGTLWLVLPAAIGLWRMLHREAA